MMHKKRRWSVTPIQSPEELARELTEHTWTCCQGFEIGGYLFLNDATCADGAQEYGVVKRPEAPGGSFVLVESVTFSWCKYDRAVEIIKKTIAGEYDQAEFATPVTVTLDEPGKHGTCWLCA